MPEEMPLYRSHKRVHALKIKGVFREGHGTEYSSTIGISFENARYEPLHGIETANRPFPAPGWYYVVYADGYHSFSPRSNSKRPIRSFPQIQTARAG